MKKYDDLILKKEKEKLKEEEENKNLFFRNKRSKEHQTSRMGGEKVIDVSSTSTPCIFTIKKTLSRLKSEENELDPKKVFRNLDYPSSAKLGENSSNKNDFRRNAVDLDKSHA